AFDLNANNGTALVNVVQRNLPDFCGDGKKDPGEQCDLGSKNGSACESCTDDCQLRWVSADCGDEPTSPTLILDPSNLKLRQFRTAERIAELLGANNDPNVNHTTKAPPPAGTAGIPPTVVEEATEGMAPTQGS